MSKNHQQHFFGFSSDAVFLLCTVKTNKFSVQFIEELKQLKWEKNGKEEKKIENYKFNFCFPLAFFRDGCRIAIEENNQTE